jgi:hypothetical protein
MNDFNFGSYVFGMAIGMVIGWAIFDHGQSVDQHAQTKQAAVVPASAFVVAAHRLVDRPWSCEWECEKETP